MNIVENSNKYFLWKLVNKIGDEQRMKCSKLCNEVNYSSTILFRGLCEDKEDVNKSISRFPYWKEETLQTLAIIPDISPNIEYVNSASIDTDILSSTVIKTPRSSEIRINGIVNLTESAAGKIMTGRILIIKGKLYETIEYATSDPYDNLRTMKAYHIFSTYISIPRELEINGQVLDALSVDFNVNTCIEDFDLRILDRRRMLNEVSILFYAIPTI